MSELNYASALAALDGEFESASAQTGGSVLLGEQFLRRAGGEVHAHLGAGHHQGVAHVVAGIAEIGRQSRLTNIF